jgi:hypothetical protein
MIITIYIKCIDHVWTAIDGYGIDGYIAYTIK